MHFKIAAYFQINHSYSALEKGVDLNPKLSAPFQISLSVFFLEKKHCSIGVVGSKPKVASLSKAFFYLDVCTLEFRRVFKPFILSFLGASMCDT